MKEFKELLAKYGVTMKHIHDRYGIPIKSMSNWKSEGQEHRECPAYVLALLDKALAVDSRTIDMGDDFTMTVVEAGDVYELWIRGAGIGIAEMMFVCPVSDGFEAAVAAGKRNFDDFKHDYIEHCMA